MLPYLAKKKDSASTGLIVKTRTPDESSASDDQDDPSAGHEACGQAIIQAIKANDGMAVAAAIQDLLALGDSDSAEPHSFDAQNQIAGDIE